MQSAVKLSLVPAATLIDKLDALGGVFAGMPLLVAEQEALVPPPEPLQVQVQVGVPLPETDEAEPLEHKSPAGGVVA